MSKLESLEKLRKYELLNRGFQVSSYMPSDELADEIQAEVDERYMELPLDADGIVWKYDDGWFITRDGNKHELDGIKIDHNGQWMLRSPLGWYLASECRHVKSRTVEDVLLDLLRELTNRSWDYIGEVERAQLNRYAAELRMAGDAK